MENVSKALLIAGAILLAIMLISVGILIINSQRNTIDEAASVGEQIGLTVSDNADIIAGYTVTRYSSTTVNKPSNGYYTDYYTGMKLDKNATYIISFDYTIEEKGSSDICCGIGVGINKPNAYNKDFVYQVKYPNQNIGQKSTFTFELNPNKYKWFKTYEDEELYLSLRLARTDPASKFKVKIENIKIKYK